MLVRGLCVLLRFGRLLLSFGMVILAVLFGRSAMRFCGSLVMFGGLIMCVLGHCLLLLLLLLVLLGKFGSHNSDFNRGWKLLNAPKYFSGEGGTKCSLCDGPESARPQRAQVGVLEHFGPEH